MILIALLLAAAPPQTQAEINDHASIAFGRADQALNVQYRATMAAMRAKDALPSDRIPGVHRTGPSRANDLLQAQRAWITHRDTQCAAEGGRYAGGTMQGMVIAQCKTRLTRERTAELKAMAAR